MEAILILLGGIVLIPALIIYSSMSWGFVMSKLWYWFLLPVFPQLPHIGFWQAVGLVVFMTMFKSHSTDGIKDEYKDKNHVWISSIIGPWITLLCAYLIYQFTQ